VRIKKLVKMPNLRFWSGIFMEVLRKTTNTLRAGGVLAEIRNGHFSDPGQMPRGNEKSD
jgi:hypothetical protein